MPKNPVSHKLMSIPTIALDCMLAEMAGLGYCEFLEDGTVFSVGPTLMQHFPGKQRELRGKPWTELRRIPFLRDLDFDPATVAECNWAGLWTGPALVQDSGCAASWMIWRSDRIPGHIVIMVRPPDEGIAHPERKARTTKEARPVQPCERESCQPEILLGVPAAEER